MSINYKEKYLKYKKKYLELKNQSGGQPEMSETEFGRLCQKASEGNTAEVLAAVDQDRRLSIRADVNGYTLLIAACLGRHDNPLLVQGLLERGANMRARTSNGLDVLMIASHKGHIAVCTVLLDRGADPDSNNLNKSALSLATRFDHLQVCLLLISRRANLMLDLFDGTALERYGRDKDPRLTYSEMYNCRATLLTAFEQGPHPDMCWKRRWPFMSVMAGCGFRPIAATIASGTTSIALDTPERRRAYYMQIIFRSDRLLRMIVSFL
jgi:hypothetical protein